MLMRLLIILLLMMMILMSETSDVSVTDENYTVIIVMHNNYTWTMMKSIS